jgi:hypothetical protein
MLLDRPVAAGEQDAVVVQHDPLAVPTRGRKVHGPGLHAGGRGRGENLDRRRVPVARLASEQHEVPRAVVDHAVEEARRER